MILQNILWICDRLLIMTAVFIIANVLSLIGNTCFTLSSIFKNKRTILSFQTVNFVLGTTSEILQKAWSGFAQDSMNLVKALILLFVDDSKKKAIIVVNVFCMTAAFAGGIILNVVLADNVWYGYLPVASTLGLSIVMLLAFVLNLEEQQNELMIKAALIVNGFCWGAYGFFVQLYPIMFFNGITIVLSGIGITKLSLSIR